MGEPTMKKHLAFFLLLVMATSGCTSGGEQGSSADLTPDLDVTAESDVPESSADTLPDLEPSTIPEGCNPLASEWDCLLPYPSDFFLVDDPSMPSGRRLSIEGAARLVRPDGQIIEPHLAHPADGFSHHPPILALFPGGVAPDNLVFHTGDVAASLGPDSPTVLLEADSGERVLHFAELDPRAKDDAHRSLLIRPMVRLRNQTRYIVAIRGLRNHADQLIPAPAGFAQIRDGVADDDPMLQETAARFETDIFPALQAAGVERDEMQLAWDFTTQTEEHVTGDMLTLRADLISRLEQAPPVVTILSVEDNVSERVLRHVEGTLRVPQYLESEEPAARLNRDANGKVVSVGFVEVPFSLRIPTSLQSAPEQTPARVIQYGHGFFASRNEVTSGWLDELADRFGFVTVATDWWGMTGNDVDAILDAIIDDPSKLMLFTDRLHQAMANQIALSYALAGPLVEEPTLQINGGPAIDATQVYFYGVSQGGILGGTYSALAPLTDRCVLGVGGASFTFMMFRSRNFASFLVLLESMVANRLESQKWVALLPTVFDRVDPITYAPHALSQLYPGSPATRRILMQNAMGDTDVTNLASHLMARALGVKHLQPSPRPISYVEPVQGATDQSAIVEFDFGLPEPLPGTTAEIADSTNPGHNGVRKLEASMTQIDLFLRPDGLIDNTCDGACDPE
jgi:hypothetical protein